MAPPPTPTPLGPQSSSRSPGLAAKRSRWATRKMTIKSSGLKRLSLLGRLQNRGSSEKRMSRASAVLGDLLQVAEGALGDDANGHPEGNPRSLYFNLPLPPELKDDNDDPLQKFPRNKIRTAKYTPLSFIPKNLWFQFHNIANIFFLFLVILVFFPIFGILNPGLNAVPLIFIITVTAIKDAIEDSRRTKSDNELNDSSVHRLCGWDNVNVKEDDVSAWRRFKKANTRFFGGLWHLIESIWSKEARAKRAKAKAERAAEANPRMSVDTRRTSIRPDSILSPNTFRASYHSAREEIQMTPVPSPLPRPDGASQAMLEPQSAAQAHAQAQAQAQDGEQGRQSAAFSFRGNSVDLAHIKTDLVNHNMPAAGKARFRKDKWKNVNVGDFIRVYNDDELPADIVVLSTSDPDGACYIETKNLDGETNLKFRTALRCGRAMRSSRDCERAQFVIESEAPQPNLYKYNGAIKWRQAVSEEGQEDDADATMRELSEPINIDNVLLRGCNLRNTEWVLGVVLFTGHDTKIMMNAGITPSKRPRIARELNFNVICNFFFLAALCIAAAIINGVAYGKTDGSLAFFEFGSIGGNPSMTGFISFWSALILFQNLVPISLYISLEIVRTAQAFFIYSDLLMYYEPIDQPCLPKSWNISDDLGQIEYIFSDKTGTLTQNVMEFKKATINGQPYGEAYTEALAGLHRRMGIDVEKEAAEARVQIAADKERAVKSLRSVYDNPYLHDEDIQFIAPDFVEDLTGNSGPEQQAANQRFMLALALCHTVIAERQPGERPRMTYKAQSPDEAALVSTARDMGFTVMGSNADEVRVNVMGEERRYPLLNTIEFNSSRKRMSAIVRVDGKIVLFCKGADSVIYSRLRKGEQQELRKTTAEHLEMFAREGLRTLCIAERTLSEDEYAAWKKEHDAAATALEDREEKLEAVADVIEQELSLIGGTAIEDRLQDGVPDTIALLAQAGIKLWVLTGDKVETAINIGFSCNLLNNDMELINLKVEEDPTQPPDEAGFLAALGAALDQNLAQFGLSGSDEDLAAARKNHEAPEPTHALVIDGFTLRWVLDESLKQRFLLLCKQCKSVLCCRVSPAQKAAVVALVKNGLDVMTLSIGDGANDVAMIQEADVGVGIAGEEGRQAVMSSDYAIAQFRFLQRLVIVHGRWSYRRLAEATSNFFYKNMIWVFALFWYQLFCDFDTTGLFDYTYILMFHLLFTSVPVILMGVLDQDVSDAVSLAVPQLYRRGIERLEWTQKKFWSYMIDGIYQGVMSFFIPYLAIVGTAFVTGNGLDVSDRLRMGAYVAHPAVLTINLFTLINTYQWDWLICLVVVISDMSIFFWTGVYTTGTFSSYFYQAAPQVYSQASFWACFVVTPIMCVFPRFFINACQKSFFPFDVDIIREQVYQGKFDRVLQEHQALIAAGNNNGSGSGSGGSNSGVVVDGIPGSGSGSGSGTGAAGGGTTSTVESTPSLSKARHGHFHSVDEEQRPIYPPSVATHTRTQTGSDGTNYTGHRNSMDMVQSVRSHPGSPEPPRIPPSQDQQHQHQHQQPTKTHASRPSMDRARPSYDRVRASMDRVRPSYEASNDFTSAARLSRVESTQSNPNRGSWQQSRFAGRLRGLSMISAKSRAASDSRQGGASGDRE